VEVHSVLQLSARSCVDVTSADSANRERDWNYSNFECSWMMFDEPVCTLIGMHSKKRPKQFGFVLGFDRIQFLQMQHECEKFINNRRSSHSRNSSTLINACNSVSSAQVRVRLRGNRNRSSRVSEKSDSIDSTVLSVVNQCILNSRQCAQ
jgi:hypothetical protein